MEIKPIQNHKEIDMNDEVFYVETNYSSISITKIKVRGFDKDCLIASGGANRKMENCYKCTNDEIIEVIKTKIPLLKS